MEYPDEEIAIARAQIVEELQSRIIDDYNESLLGKKLEILCDGFDEDSGMYFGRSYADSPDVDGRVWIAAQEPIREGDFVTVCIDGNIDGELSGYIVEE